MRTDTPRVGYPPYRQVHAHSTANPNSTVQNEADYMARKDLNTGYYTHVVGNGRIIQTAPTNRGAWDVGGGWNAETYAAVELIESHKTKEEFMIDYPIYVDLLRRLATEGGIPTTLDSARWRELKHTPTARHISRITVRTTWIRILIWLSGEYLKNSLKKTLNKE